MARIQKLIGKWHDSSVWWLLAVVLGSSSRYTIWPAYVWLREQWIAVGWLSRYTWPASAFYFSFWVWLFVLLARGGRRYRGMIFDSLCGGLLLAVAATLHDPAVRAVLSKVGFGAAALVTFLSASALVVLRAAQRHESQSAGGTDNRSI
jgi:hypothetical protein